MSQPGIEFVNVWKKFHRGELHDSLRDLIPDVARRLVGRGPRRDELAEGDFWALRDVSFRVHPGDVLGIIGANGAGKSTILKTISRILRPNRGVCRVQGRVGALIEVSAGFHPDLTGRENVFLQGAILGMRTSAIKAKFDEIVEFAGVADFIDTPVKRYSTGMNARLGFAIAAHLDPDVLLIDEVLSVGDFAFQEKAFHRVGSLARSGLPVVVVSHQLNRIADLCTSAVLLDQGRVLHEGPASECIEVYVSGRRSEPATQAQDCPVVFESVALLDDGPIRSGEWIRARIRGSSTRPVPPMLEAVGVRIRALTTGELVFATSCDRLGVELPPIGPFEVEVDLQANLPAGSYVLEVVTWDRDRNRDAATAAPVRLQVLEGRSFWGSVQMNPGMRLTGDSRQHAAGRVLNG